LFKFNEVQFESTLHETDQQAVPRWLIYFGPLTQSVSISLFKDAFIEKRLCTQRAAVAVAAHQEFRSRSALAKVDFFYFLAESQFMRASWCSHGLYMPLIMPIQPRFCLSRSQMFK
jgi:hypothetical protein